MKWLRKLLNRKTDFRRPDIKIYIKSGANFFDSFEFYLRHRIAMSQAEFATNNEPFQIKWERLMKNAEALTEAAIIDALSETATYKDKK